MVSTHPLISKSFSLFTFGDCTKSANYNWYNHHFYVPQFFFQFPSKVQVLIFLIVFFQFYADVSRDIKVYNSASSLLQGPVVWPRFGDLFVSQTPRGVLFLILFHHSLRVSNANVR